MKTTTENVSVESLKKELVDIDDWRTKLTQKIKELENMGQKELENKLATLHQYLGVPTLEDALLIIKRARNVKTNVPQKAAPLKELSQLPNRKSWGRGRKIPGNIREEVVNMLKSEQYTAAEVSKKTGISPAAVNKIKKNAGLVNERSVIR